MNQRLAPENPFPIGINDAYEGMKWVSSHSLVLVTNPYVLLGG